MQLQDHPQFDRLLAAYEAGGFSPGDDLPYHQPNCYGCGPDNDRGFGLTAVAGGPGEVEGAYLFDERYEGGPGVAHGGAVSAVMDDLLGRVLVRELVIAVTVELSVSFHRAVHLGEPCRLRAQLTERDERDLSMEATLEQQGIQKVSARARFREIGFERAVNRYERVQ